MGIMGMADGEKDKTSFAKNGLYSVLCLDVFSFGLLSSDPLNDLSYIVMDS